jgi:hypothetical protein
MSLATASTVVSGVVVATALTITSLALIVFALVTGVKLPAPTPVALMWINATFNLAVKLLRTFTAQIEVLHR